VRFATGQMGRARISVPDSKGADNVSDTGAPPPCRTTVRARDLLIPVVHETTYDELRKVSPLLSSRNGLNTADDSMADIATKIAELVAVEDDLTAPLTWAN
jgi:hypothetical protein